MDRLLGILLSSIFLYVFECFYYLQETYLVFVRHKNPIFSIYEQFSAWAIFIKGLRYQIPSCWDTRDNDSKSIELEYDNNIYEGNQVLL